MKIFEAIKGRRSVRSYDGRKPDGALLRELSSFAGEIKNPYEKEIAWFCLDAEEKGLNSSVLVGEKVYFTGKLKKEAHFEEAFGYAFETLLLYARTRGLEGVWIAGTMNREAFESAVDLREDEIMPAVSPLGYAAEKMSLRESLMRKGTGADKRKPFSELFFDGSFEVPLKKENAGRFSDALEAVRIAPSAVNRQPWRIVLCKNGAHFFEKKSAGYDKNGFDIQKLDLGIALCHFDLALNSARITHEFALCDPGLNAPEGCVYIASYLL